MPEILGSAILRLSTDSSKLDKGIKSAREKAQNLSAGFLKAGAAVSAIGIPFALMGKAALDNADKLNKMSEKVGISVEDLSGLKFAAELSGTTIDSLQSALGRFSGNAADTSKGVGEAKEAFEALGISVVDVDGALRPSNDLLLEVADKFSQMKDGTEKTAIAMDLFGRSGLDLIPMLNQGRDGIIGMKDEAASLGLILSEEGAASAAAFNDAVTKLTGAFSGFFTQLIESGLVDHLTSFVETTASLISEFLTANPLLVAAGGALGLMALVIGPLLIAMGLMIPAIVAIGPVLAGVIAVLTGPVGIGIAIGAVVAVFAGFILKNEAVQKALKKVWDKIKKNLDKVLKSIKKLFKTVSKALEAIWDKWGGSIEKIFKTLWKVVKGLIKPAFDLIEGVLSGALTVLSGLIDTFTGLVTGDWTTFADGLKAIWEGIWTAIKAVITAPFTAIKNTITTFTSGIKGLFSGLKTDLVGQSIVTDMLDLIKGQFERLPNEMTGIVETETGNVKTAFDGLQTDVDGWFGDTGTISGGMVGGFGGIGDAVKNLTGVDVLGALGEKLSGLTSKIPGLSSIAGAFDGIIASVQGVIDKVGSLLDTLKDTLGGIAITGVNVSFTTSFTEVAITGVAIQTGIFNTGVSMSGIVIQKGEFNTGIAITGLSLGFSLGGGKDKEIAFNTRLLLGWTKDFFPVFNASNDRMEGLLGTIRDLSVSIKWWAEHHGIRLQNISDRMDELIPIQRDRIAPAVEGIRTRLDSTLNVNVSNTITISAGSSQSIASAVKGSLASQNRSLVEQIKRELRTNKSGLRSAIEDI